MGFQSFPRRIAMGLLVAFIVPGSLFMGETQAQVPFFSGDRILVEGAVNGTKVHLLLDTGATHSALFLPAAKQLGVVGENPPVAGDPPFQLSEPFQLDMFGKQARLRLPMLDYTTQEPISGIFSWKNLGARLLLIDGYQRTVAPLLEAPKSDRWQQWKLEEDNSQLCFHVTENEKPYGRVFLDTGAVCGLRVHPKVWKKWRDENQDAGITLGTFRYGLGETMVHEMGWAHEFALGDLVFYDVMISPFTEEEAKRGGDDYLAMIGILALRNMRVLVDRETNSVFTESIAPAHIHNRLGAVFVADESQQGKLIAHVLDGSPADKAGIENGDVLVGVEGLEAPSEFIVNQLFFQPAGTQVKLKLQQGEKENELTVELKDLLP